MAKFKITGLPKAQYGKNKVTLEASPFSLNANQAQLASSVYGEYDPEFLIGASMPIGGSRDPRIKNSLSLTAGLPLNGTAVPSINAGYKFRYRPSSMNAGAFAPTTQLDVGAGWDPTQGLNFQAKVNPRWEFMNKQAPAYLKHNWPVGAWRGYAGPSGGLNLRQNSFVPGLAGYGTQEKTAGNINLFYGAEAGIEGRPFKKTPLRVGLDASLLMNLAKKQAEESFNPETDFGKSATGFTPMIKAKVVYPLGTAFPKKKEASEEKIKLDAIKANDKNYVADAPVISGPGVDWDYKEKQQQSGTPTGYLPGYEPETGRQLTEEEVMQRYSQGPTLEYGGTSEGMYMDLTDDEIEQYKQGGYVVEDLPEAQKGGEKIYTYADRPDATYKKDAKGDWLISLPSTDGKYVPIKDPSGKRAGELNEKAKPVEKPTLMTKAYSSVKDFNRLPEADKKATAAMYAYNESMRQKGYTQNPLTGDFVHPNTPTALNNFNDGALQSADWLWTLPIGLPAVTQTLGGIGAMSLPGMASIPGATVGNLVNSGFIASSLTGAPGNVMDWYNVLQGKKDWKEAAMDSADIALGFMGSGSGWKSIIQDAKTLKAPSKIVGKTSRAVGNLVKPSVLSAKPNQYSISGQRGAAGNTGLEASHVDDVRNKAIARLQSDDYLKKRMANTGETEEQVRADVNKIISEAENTKYNLNASLGPNIMGEQTPKGLQNLWRYPTVDISKNAENPITTLIHENNHLYSPVGYTNNMAPLIRGWDNPNIASVPFGKKRGVYANYPQLGVTDDIGEYEAKEWEQQVRHLNARDQIISANNLAEDAKVTPEMVEKFGQNWFKRMKTEGAVADDYDIIWESELKNVRDALLKEKGFANTTELEKNLTEAERSAFLKEVRKRWSEKVAGVLNKAWMGVPAVIGAGALGAGATDAEFKKGGFPKNIGKLKKFIR